MVIRMASSDTVSAVLEFYAAYRSAFDGHDAEAIVGFYRFPCHIVSDGDSVASLHFVEPASLKPTVERVLELHRKIGVRSGRALLLEIAELSPRMAGMMLRYEMNDADGAPLYDYQGFYSLVATDDGYRIAAICHNQIPRLSACVARVAAATV
jgi:hypothetical protein